MIERIKSGWTLVKFIRVGLGGLILYSSVETGHTAGIVIGGLFTVMGLMGGGACCAMGACNVPATRKENSPVPENVEYEELGNK